MIDLVRFCTRHAMPCAPPGLSRNPAARIVPPADSRQNPVDARLRNGMQARVECSGKTGRVAPR
jgi:hypothetical protein